MVLACGLPDFWDAEDLAVEMGDHPCVWTGGSLDSFARADVLVVGAGVHLLARELATQGATWSEVEEYGAVGYVPCFLCQYLALLQTVQRQSCGVLSWPCRHSGLGIWVLIT